MSDKDMNRKKKLQKLPFFYCFLAKIGEKVGNKQSKKASGIVPLALLSVIDWINTSLAFRLVHRPLREQLLPLEYR